MTPDDPISKLIERVLQKTFGETAPAATLDSELRKRGCWTGRRLAMLFDLSLSTIDRLRHEGMPAHKIRGQWRYYGQEVADWLRGCDERRRLARTEKSPPLRPTHSKGRAA